MPQQLLSISCGLARPGSACSTSQHRRDRIEGLLVAVAVHQDAAAPPAAASRFSVVEPAGRQLRAPGTPPAAAPVRRCACAALAEAEREMLVAQREQARGLQADDGDAAFGQGRSACTTSRGLGLAPRPPCRWPGRCGRSTGACRRPAPSPRRAPCSPRPAARVSAACALADSKKPLKVSTNSTTGLRRGEHLARACAVPCGWLKKCRAATRAGCAAPRSPSSFSPSCASSGLRLRRFSSGAKRLAVRA